MRAARGEQEKIATDVRDVHLKFQVRLKIPGRGFFFFFSLAEHYFYQNWIKVLFTSIWTSRSPQLFIRLTVEGLSSPTTKNKPLNFHLFYIKGRKSYICRPVLQQSLGYYLVALFRCYGYRVFVLNISTFYQYFPILQSNQLQTADFSPYCRRDRKHLPRMCLGLDS